MTTPASAPSVKVLIAGGSYAGLSTTLNLFDLGQGHCPRSAQEKYTHHMNVPLVNFDITIVDKRDGFCMYLANNTSLAHRRK